jgi:tetrapyrrole methylase family protein/MazG family protein
VGFVCVVVSPSFPEPELLNTQIARNKSRTGLSGRWLLDFRPFLASNIFMSKSFDELIAVMERLRAPGGCPWDAEQTYQSLSQYLLEEAYETFDAIHEATETSDTANLKEELGDLLLQVVFHSTIGKERGDFTIDEVAEGVAKKLVLRHPHVFGDANLARAQDVLDNWDKLKADERAASGKVEKPRESILEEVPLHFPGLLEGLKLTKKAAKVGFDWENAEQIFAKIDEENAELKAAIHSDDKNHIAEEIGDLLFAVVNLARHLNVEPETALKQTNRKFRQRFKFIELELAKSGKTLDEASLAEMDELWNLAKRRLASHNSLAAPAE